jgi:hypothetical protein
MLSEIHADIVSRLSEITAAKTVEPWLGEEESLLTQPAKLPGLYVAYDGATFEAKKVVGSNRADLAMIFTIIVINKNLQSRAAGAEDIYTLIEAVRAKLIGYTVLTYGWLWPIGEELIAAETGYLVYGLKYRLSTHI